MVIVIRLKLIQLGQLVSPRLKSPICLDRTLKQACTWSDVTQLDSTQLNIKPMARLTRRIMHYWFFFYSWTISFMRKFNLYLTFVLFIDLFTFFFTKHNRILEFEMIKLLLLLIFPWLICVCERDIRLCLTMYNNDSFNKCMIIIF